MDENQKEKSEVVIVLDTPIEWGKEMITEVRLGALKGAHMKTLSWPPTPAQLLTIASKISGLSGGVFDEMDAKDVSKVIEAVGGKF